MEYKGFWRLSQGPFLCLMVHPPAIFDKRVVFVKGWV